MDFHHGNLLFDDEYNLTGVIDWGMAQAVPLERLAVSPEFVAGQLYPKEHKESVAKLLSLMRDALQDLQRETMSGDSTSSHDNQAAPARGGDCDADEEAESDVLAGGDDVDLHSAQRTTLADIFGTVQAEIANRCSLSNPRKALLFGRMVQSLVYGQHVSWEQMVLAFGEIRLQ